MRCKKKTKSETLHPKLLYVLIPNPKPGLADGIELGDRITLLVQHLTSHADIQGP